MKYKLVSLDLDGTLVKVPSIAVVLSFVDAGKLVKFNALEYALNKGVLSYEEAMESELRLLEGIQVKDVKRAMDKAPYIKGIRETVLELQLEGIRTILVSDNPDVICRLVAERFGIGDYICSKTIVKDGVIVDYKEFVFDKLSKVKEYIERFNIDLSECAHVGDWDNDIGLLKNVGLGIAFNPQNERVEKSAKVVLRGQDLRMILDYIIDSSY